MDTLRPGSPEYESIRNLLLNPTVETVDKQMRIMLGTGEKISAFLNSRYEGQGGRTMADLTATTHAEDLRIVLAQLILLKYGRIGGRHRYLNTCTGEL